MPTFLMNCQDCGHEHETPMQTRFSELEKIIKDNPCQNCGGVLRNVPLGGTGFQLSNRKPDNTLAVGGWDSRGRCMGKSL